MTLGHDDGFLTKGKSVWWKPLWSLTHAWITSTTCSPNWHPLGSALLWIQVMGQMLKNCGPSGPSFFSLKSGIMASSTASCSFIVLCLVKCTSYFRMTWLGYSYYTCWFFCKKAEWVAEVFFTESLFLLRHSRNSETFLLLTCTWHTSQLNRVSTGPWQGTLTAWRLDYSTAVGRGPRCRDSHTLGNLRENIYKTAFLLQPQRQEENLQT